ncbi:MAG: hypothetical protein ACQEWM_12220 [Actinomycetota bacterium]
MFDRLIPTQLFRGHWKALSDYRSPTPVGDKVTRGVIIGVPLLAGVAVVALDGSLSAPGALLSGVALLAGGFLAAFAQITNLRFKLTERMRDFPDAERVDRDALDETASHLLVAAYLSGLTALLLVLAMNFGTNALGAVNGGWAGVVVAPATYVLLTFLIALPRLYSAYVTFNAVRPELSGTHR